MSAREKSDLPEVAEKRANKVALAAAELVERRGGAKENAELQSTVRTQSREAVSQAQARIREAVDRNRQDKLTALLHHLTIDVLRASFFGLKKSAAPGVDEITWTEYAEGLEDNLSDLHSRVQTGAYRALHRVAHLIVTEEGTPQGAVISPLLANVYLHYVYDLWAHQWRQRCATGDVIVVRYADDTIVGFEHQHEAERFRADLKARFVRFGLTLHPDKTRLIEFGRSAIANRLARGLGKPESFDFLGFAHYCATRRSGSGFVLGRKPVAKRMRAKLREIKEQLMAIRHEGIERQGLWLRQVLRGWMAYYSVPMSGPAISAFRHHIIERWHGALMRRSQRRRLTWPRMKKVADRHLPFPRILHPWPEKRFLVTIQGGSPVR